MQIALFADALLQRGGAEKTFEVICRAFPQADIYTTRYDPDLAPEGLHRFKIRSLVRGRRFGDYDGLRRNFLGAIFQLQQVDFSDYDLVLSSAAHLARFIRKGRARHLSYTYYPFRLLYETDLYPQIKGGQRLLLHTALPWLRAWDRRKGRQVDRFITISRASQQAVARYYGADSEIIPAPILNLPDRFERVNRGDYFLLVSRLEPWKRLEGVIEAFDGLNHRLVVVGDGPDRDRLARGAGPNVTFAGRVGEVELSGHYQRCRAVIHPTATEYGLTPIEANAHGTPAICLGVRGVFETMIPYHHRPQEATALFYDEPTAACLRAAIQEFDQLVFDPLICFKNAQRFSPETFISRLSSYVNQFYQESMVSSARAEPTGGA